jgi:hypothetical protein
LIGVSNELENKASNNIVTCENILSSSGKKKNNISCDETQTTSNFSIDEKIPETPRKRAKSSTSTIKPEIKKGAEAGQNFMVAVVFGIMMMMGMGLSI